MGNNALSVYRESTLALTFNIRHRKEGTGFDLTGYTAQFMVKANIYDKDANAVLTKSVANLGSNGQIIINLTVNDTKLAAGTYEYSLRLLYGSTLRTVVLKDKFTVVPFWKEA